MSGSEHSQPGQVGALGATLRRGAVISGAAFVVVQVIAFGQLLVLARLLSPEEVGVYAAGTVLTGFLLMFSDSGLSSALIHSNRNEDDVADTVFRASLLAGLVSALLALAVAPLVGWVFDSRTAGLIAAIVSGTLLLHSLTIVPDSVMQRRFDFRRRLILNPCYTFAFAVSAVVLAAMGWGVWALVVGEYVSYLVWITLAWTLAKWRPGHGRPTFRLWRELARYAFPIVVGSVGVQISRTLETVVVGRGLDQTALGHFRYGRRLSMLPAVAVVEIGSYVLFPAFSRIAGEPVRLRAAYLRALRWMWFGVVPVAGLMVILGEPAVVVLLGERWRATGSVLAALAGYGLGEALAAVSVEVIKGCGRTKLFHWLTAFYLVTSVGLLLLLLPLGLVGVGVAISVAALLSGIVEIDVSRRLVDVRIGEIARVLWPPLACTAVAGLVLALLDRLVIRPDRAGFVGGLGLIAAECVIFGLAYLAAARLFAPEMARTTGAAVLSVARRIKRSRGAQL